MDGFWGSAWDGALARWRDIQPCIRYKGFPAQLLLLVGRGAFFGGVATVGRLWNIADLIDLHFFCQIDAEIARKSGEAALVKRDRVIYLAKIKRHQGVDEEMPARLLVRRWLTARRLQFRQEKHHQGQVLPGSLWQELSVLARGLALLCGVLIGAGAAASLLLYSGSTPLNVSVYFGLFVLAQGVLVIGQAGLLLARRLRRLPLEESVLSLLLGRLLVRILEVLRRLLRRHVDGQRRLDLAALMGDISQQREMAVLLLWPAFTLVQLLGIGCNLGILGATLAKVVFSDMAFAWQSSLQLSPELVAQLVQWLALPWSWIGPEAAPSLVQIQGSQMVLKEGVAHLNSADLQSWWPFLCLSVAVYGLLPRCLLLAFGWLRQRRALEQLHFASLQFRPLLQRLTAPRLDIQGEDASVGTPAPPAAAPVLVARNVEFPQVVTPDPAPVAAIAPAPSSTIQGPALLLIAEELFADCPVEPLIAVLKPQFPGLHLTVQPYDGFTPPALPAEALPAELLILAEAWQPPLRETEALLALLRQTLGATTPITIVLIGKPTATTMLTPPAPEQLYIWRQKMRALGDTMLAVQPLITP